MGCTRCGDEVTARGMCFKHYYLVSHHINRVRLMKLLGGIKCVECDCCDMRCLQFHHIENDGKADRKKRGAGFTFVRFYVLRPELAKKKLQVMCANHNQIHMKIDIKNHILY